MKTTQRIGWMIALSALHLGVCALAAAQTVTEADSQTPPYHDDIWHTSVSPYLWLAGANGTI